LVTTLEQVAGQTYRALVLRTDTPAAARFYEALGYTRLPSGNTATHRRELMVASLSSVGDQANRSAITVPLLSKRSVQ
jgi:hypothetical protein